MAFAAMLGYIRTPESVKRLDDIYDVVHDKRVEGCLGNLKHWHPDDVRDENAAPEKEAKRRISLVAEQPAQDAERLRTVTDPGAEPKAKQKKRESIVIERDESDSSEDDVRDARVYFVRKNKAPQVVAPPIEAEIRPKTPDPLDGIYRQMFGGSSNFI